MISPQRFAHLVLAATILLCVATANATMLYVDPGSPTDGPGNDSAYPLHFRENAPAVAAPRLRVGPSKG